MVEVAGQLTIRVGLFEEQLGPVLERGDRISARREPQRRIVARSEADQSVGELSWIADLLPNEMAPPIAGMIDLGMAAMKKTLESAAPAA